jgi:hypothetical protein
MWLGRVVGSASRRLGVGVGWVDQNRILLGLRVARRGRRLPMRCAPCVAPRVPPRPSRVARLHCRPHSLGLYLLSLSLSLSLSARILSLVATAKERGEHRTRLTSHERGQGAVAPKQSTVSSAGNAHGTVAPSALPRFLSMSHALGLHCMCCQRDLHAIRPCGGCKPPISWRRKIHLIRGTRRRLSSLYYRSQSLLRTGWWPDKTEHAARTAEPRTVSYPPHHHHHDRRWVIAPGSLSRSTSTSPICNALTRNRRQLAAGSCTRRRYFISISINLPHYYKVYFFAEQLVPSPLITGTRTATELQCVVRIFFLRATSA